MAARPRRRKSEDKKDKADRRLHPEPLHLGPRPDTKALGDPEPLHPESLHLEHVGEDEGEEAD